VFEPGTIAQALLSLKTASEIASLIRASGLSLSEAETKMKFADLIITLADLKVQLADVRNELLERDEKIAALTKELKGKAEMQWEAPYYWAVHPDGKKDGPYCQQCFDKEGKLIRLQDNGSDYWMCKTCNSGYEGKNYRTASFGSFPRSGGDNDWMGS
jgi:hypothetical protein